MCAHAQEFAETTHEAENAKRVGAGKWRSLLIFKYQQPWETICRSNKQPIGEEGKLMWYVMQVRTGKEQETLLQCQKLISAAVLEKSFLPYYKAMKRYQGEWHLETRILFPGYVFLVTDQPERLFLELKKVPSLTKLLGTGQEIVPLTREEIAFLTEIGHQEQVVEMSVGVIENGKLHVLEGPLRGMEELVKKIDRHKRKAWVEVKMFGKMVDMEVGVEIVEKR